MFNSDKIILIIATSFLMPLLLSSVLIWFLVSYQKRKNQHELDQKNYLLVQQKHIIEKQEAIVNERTRIASEMHDDLGSGLTTIKYLSEIAIKGSENENNKKIIEKIATHSKDLVKNMSEIIWTMNTRFDDSMNLASFMRRYAIDFFSSHQLEIQFEINHIGNPHFIGGENRRDLFLIFKELLNNSIKYSNATLIKIQLDLDDEFYLKIVEVGGSGFTYDSSVSNGNGLFNISKRMMALGGIINYTKENKNMLITLIKPYKN